jgi:hypothetical protein
LRLLFPSHPLSPPTDHEILGKTEPTEQKFFGEKISGKRDLHLCECARKSAAITGSIEGHAPGLPPFMALPIAFDAASGRGCLGGTIAPYSPSIVPAFL